MFGRGALCMNINESAPPHVIVGVTFILKGRWRGALLRQNLRQATMRLVERKEQPRESISRKKKKRLKNQATGNLEQAGRCLERVAWEESWARVRLERPSYRDRVRVWQAIVELKRAGGKGKMGITNSEAWQALCDSSGSTSVAATRLASEEYVLGRRLQEQVLEIPSYLSLGRAVFHASNRHETKQKTFPAKASGPLYLAHTGKEPGMGDIFEYVSSAFYNAPKTPAEGKSKKTTDPK